MLQMEPTLSISDEIHLNSITSEAGPVMRIKQFFKLLPAATNNTHLELLKTLCCLSPSCHSSSSYQCITWLIWQGDLRFAVGIQGSGQENSLFMIPQRLQPCIDAVANWKMNENWQVSQGNQFQTIGLQYGNAKEIITWKHLQCIPEFSFLRDNIFCVCVCHCWKQLVSFQRKIN